MKLMALLSPTSARLSTKKNGSARVRTAKFLGITGAWVGGFDVGLAGASPETGFPTKRCRSRFRQAAKSG
jgi:hypothetical protein